jgi:hypothetical protein
MAVRGLVVAVVLVLVGSGSPAAAGPPAHRSDVILRRSATDPEPVGDDVYDRSQFITPVQHFDTTVRYLFDLENDGSTTERLLVTADMTQTTGGPNWARVRWFIGRRNVTDQVQAGRHPTRRLAPGESVRLVAILHIAPDIGGNTRFSLATIARPEGRPRQRDRAVFDVIARR